MKRPALYNIPSGRPFARDLVRGVLSIDGDDPARLSRRLILLPTRRACRVVREAFLGETGGRPLLLPRLQPLGEVDDEEMMRLRAERGGRAGGWSAELSRKREFEEAFSSIWI